MNPTRPLLLAMLLAVAVPTAGARIVTSTAEGGPWSATTTWHGSVVPDTDDDVVIAGPVQVDGAYLCRSLGVEPAGTLSGATVAGYRLVEVEGPVINQGVITDGDNSSLRLDVAGDLINAGEWSNYKTQPIDAGDRELRDTSPGGFTTYIEATAGAVGDLVATTPVVFADRVDLAGLRLVLAPGSHLTLQGHEFEGIVQAGGNEIRFQDGAYLDQATIGDAELVGYVKVAFGVHFQGRVEIRDWLESAAVPPGGGAITVEGVLVNHGTIQDAGLGFDVQILGDLENDGAIAVPVVEFIGAGVEHRLSMSPGSVLDSPIVLSDQAPSALVAATPVIFTRDLDLGAGTLRIAAGASVHFGAQTGLDAGTVLADGNPVTTEPGSRGLTDVTIDQAVFGDHVAVGGDIHLTGDATIQGMLTGGPDAAADITVEGRLRVEGAVTDGDHPVQIVARGDVENLGVMDNARVVLHNIYDQAVGVGPGIAVPEFVLESHVAASEYQWLRDGVPIPGEVGPSLTFASLTAADHGLYHCDTDGLVLRYFLIAESLDTTDVPPAGLAQLEQNRPNPFNPNTEIAFTLDRSGPVSLAVYDLAGRLVDRLSSGPLGAGRHVITWQPRGVASGTYVYRLRAPGVNLARTCSLLK